MNKKISLPIALLVCSCFFFLGFGWSQFRNWRTNEPPNGINISQYLDTTVMINIETHKKITIDSITMHRRNILFFWSHDCLFCDDFLTNYNTLKYDSQLIGFPIDLEYTQSCLSTEKNVYPQILIYNTNEDIINPFRIKATPTIFVTDNKGNIIYSQIGGKITEDFINAIK
jgi:hypothetical protein